jgi:uncharacterized membrane protein YhaH (DUF805 family)
MNFSTAISVCMGKYGTFKGRASRSEFWWFYLFTVLLSWGGSIVGASTDSEIGADVVSTGISLIFLVPVIAVGSRRLHDINKSGWWQLILLTGIGAILLIIWWAKEGTKEINEYGEPILTNATEAQQ